MLRAVLPSEAIRVSLFVAAIIGVYAAAAWAAFRALGERLLDWPPPAKRWVQLRRWVLAAAALGILCFAYGYFVEPYWLEVTRVRIETAKLPPGTRPLRLVHISDLHCDLHPRLEKRLPEVIAAEKPDLIVFTGDALNTPLGLPHFKECLSRLASIAPTFAVKGNWDTMAGAMLDLYGGTEARELDGESLEINVAGASLWIAGAAARGEGGIDKALDAVPPGAFTVFLHHYPDWVERVARRKVDLYCAGHTHGGQVALPFYGALVTLSRFGKRFEAGLYRVGGTWLYVNRGIGMEGGLAPRVRFCARPEVTVIEIAPGPEA